LDQTGCELIMTRWLYRGTIWRAKA